jgi:N6-L-threonylcarbamoyladenine synthase
MNILGIETSCDENAVAVVKDGRHILSNVVYSQIDLHKMYGGVVPEVAARSHIEVMLPVVQQALERAFGSETPNSQFDPWSQVDAIAVANGPGLGGSLLIGTLTARTLALIKNKPLYAVHHALGHIYANFIEPTPNPQPPTPNLWKKPEFPLIALIVSGGHSHLVLMRGHFDYQLLGQTKDDAVGEAFDKVAKLLGLPYPGGPSVSRAAEAGDPHFLKLPKAKMEGAFDFSFSGLKTAVLRAVQELVGVGYDFPSTQLSGELSARQVADVAASFQYTAVATLVDKTVRAYEQFGAKTIVIAGGVAANTELRRQLQERTPIDIHYAPPGLCTDNGAMIAALGYYRAQRAEPVDIFSLDIEPSLRL